MKRFGFGFFVGLAILFIGAFVAFDALFSVHLPIVRGAVAFVLIAIGLRVLVRPGAAERRGPSSGEAWMADRHFVPDALLGDSRYDVVFGRGVVDLTRVPEPAEDVTVTVDAVFGSAVIRIDPEVAYDVTASAAFGEVHVPPHRASADHPPHLHLRLNAVFGACDVVEAPAA